MTYVDAICVAATGVFLVGAAIGIGMSGTASALREAVTELKRIRAVLEAKPK